MMCTLILFVALCVALASSCPGQTQANWEQVQGANPYWPSARSRQQIHYGPVFIHSYGRRPHPFYRSRSEPGINQPYNGEYMTHLLLANQVPGPSNDNMAQLLYDNTVQPQQINARNAARNEYIYDPAAQYQQTYSRNVAPQSLMYPGLYTRFANNLDVIDDDYVLVPAVTCIH